MTEDNNVEKNFNSDCRVLTDQNERNNEEQECLKNQIAQERTIFVIIIILIFDSFLFFHLEGTFSSIPILIIELILMCLVGKLLNNEFFSNLMDKIFDAFKKRF